MPFLFDHVLIWRPWPTHWSQPEIAERNRARAKAGLAALEGLWSDMLQQYVCFDRVSGRAVDSASVGGLLPAFAGVPTARMDSLAKRITVLGEQVNYLVPSHDPSDSRYDGKRYWRGPAWLIVNYMIADGLQKAGHTDLVEKIKQASLKLIDESGFAEYYDPQTGEPLGGDTFTWTAAMVMEFLRDSA